MTKYRNQTCREVWTRKETFLRLHQPKLLRAIWSMQTLAFRTGPIQKKIRMKVYSSVAANARLAMKRLTNFLSLIECLLPNYSKRLLCYPNMTSEACSATKRQIHQKIESWRAIICLRLWKRKTKNGRLMWNVYSVGIMTWNRVFTVALKLPNSRLVIF